MGESIEDKLKGIFAKQLGVDRGTILRETKIADLDMDSLDGVELVMQMEGAYDVKIPEEESDKFVNYTFGEVVDYVTGRVSEKGQ
jgi:acyl carrier protein